MNKYIYYIKNENKSGNGNALCTEEVQKAIDDCHAQGGGTVNFPAGKYALSTVFLKSNVTIEIPEG
ncbi:MAG: glycoside hydrolase family 28 protein, partial [Candidatus Scatosoma sp.]